MAAPSGQSNGNGFKSKVEQNRPFAFKFTKTEKLPDREAGHAEPPFGERGNLRRRVLAISYQFPPCTLVGAQSCAQIYRHLPSYGWDVIVLTVQERYVEETDGQTSEEFPGKVIRTRVISHPFFLYRELKAGLTRTSDRSIDVSMEWTDSPKKDVKLRRWLLSILCIPDPYTGWILPAFISGADSIRHDKVDCLFSSGPWWTNHLVGWALAQWSGLPWVAHFRDPWTQAEWLKPVSNLSVGIEEKLERLILRKARAVVCVTEQHTALLRQIHSDLPLGKFMTIPNGYDGAEWDAALGDRAVTVKGCDKEERFVIAYAGSLYYRRSPYPLFRALRSLIDSGEITREHIRVELLGDCETADGARVADVAAAYRIADQVNVAGLLARTETLRRIARSNLLLLLAENWSYRIPAKTYEYLRAGRPILALTSEPAVVDLLRRVGGGWAVDPKDEPGIMAAVREAYHCWRNGVDPPLPNPNVVSGFDRRALAGQFAGIFERSIPGSSR